MNDPKRSFVVRSITREDIASNLNAFYEANVFTADDPMLTDEVCQDIADSLDDARFERDQEAAEMEIFTNWADALRRQP